MSSQSCDRRRFVQVLSGAVGAAVLLPACGQGTDGTVTVTGGSAKLSFAQFPALMSAGGSVVVNTSTGDAVAVVRTGADTAVALDAVCTHAGCLVGYNSGSMELDCPCHGSVFDLSGGVVRGPARSPLRQYATAISSDGITVTNLP